MSRLIAGPFNRVEGDLEVHLQHESGRVTDARVVSSLYRGFEHMLVGKKPEDALVYAPRICGICSVSQSVAAATALADAMGLTPSPNGQLSINLTHACENLADHLTHFYLFFMPDFANPVYRSEDWYEHIAERFRAIKGQATAEFLPARARFMHLMGVTAGKWPHSLAIRPGGVSKAITASDKTALRGILVSMRKFMESSLFASSLEEIAALDSLDALANWLQAQKPGHSDFGDFLMLSSGLGLENLGRSYDQFMSFGAYRQDNDVLFRRGIYTGSKQGDLDEDAIAEDLSHAWYQQAALQQSPTMLPANPDIHVKEAYSWCKAPRLAGKAMETGALARQLINGQPLVLAMVDKAGANVHSRVIARLVEAAQLLLAMENWLDKIDVRQPFGLEDDQLKDGQGRGMVEAARGSLGHWLKVQDGQIKQYQIIAPTTWNFSPRDESGLPGPLEKALQGAEVKEGEKQPISVQHIVRSFDPCLVCTVH